MPNPILIFLDLDRFGFPNGWRRGVKPDGSSEDITPGVQYSLILLGDQDQLDELSFQHNRDEAMLGVEHGSWPVRDARQAALTTICGRYECAYVFRHIDNNDIFEYMKKFFRATDDAQRQKTVTAIADLIKSLDRWNGLVQFLMNRQIGFLGGNKVDIMQLPRSAVEFHNKLEDGASYTAIIEDFLSSSPPT